MVYLSVPNNPDTKDVAEVSESLRPTGRPLQLGQRSFPFHDFTFNLSEEPSVTLTVNVRANTPLTDLIRSGFAAFTTIDGMPTVPASLRIGLGAKWKNSEGARQVPLPNGMTLAGT